MEDLIEDPKHTKQSDLEGRKLILKLKSVLLQLISPEFRLSDDTILQKLFDCVSKTFPVEGSNLSLLEVFLPWIDTVIKDWKVINPSSCSFALRILSLIASNEKHFVILLKSNILSGFRDHFKDCHENKSTILSAHLDFIQSIISHQPGCSWVFENDIWKDLLFISNNNSSLYALRQAHRILAKLIVHFGNEQVVKCHKILDEIFLPCCDMPAEKHSLLHLQSEINNIPYHYEYFNGPLNHLNSLVIMKETLLKLLLKRASNVDINNIFGKYNLQVWICDAIQNTTNFRVIAELSRLLCVVNVGMLPHSEDNRVKYSDVRLLVEQFLTHCNILVKKHQFLLIQEVAIEYFKLWNEFGGEINYETNEINADNTYKIENTFFIILTLPLFIFIRLSERSECDLFEAYAGKVFGKACPSTQRTGYSYRYEITLKFSKELTNVASSSIQCFLRITNICKKEQAVMIFQTLAHVVQAIFKMTNMRCLIDDKVTGVVDYKMLESFRDLFSSTITALDSYISNFNLSWSDSLETVYILPMLQVAMILPDLPLKLTVNVLKLQKVVLLGYLPPNLALLMDTTEGTSIRFIGKQIFKNLHSFHWEVRDSALELLHVISDLSEQKFPSFQKLILGEEANLPLLVVSVFQNDSEPFVRSSAANCLSSLVRIQAFWDESLFNHSFVENLLGIILNEPEGIVRYRSVLLLKEIYNCRQLSTGQLDKIMDVIYHVTITDLYWEVKNGALIFWDCVLEKKLSEEGMVDGQFPDHIFSREKRKIIKLTSAETSSKIQKVFESLSDSGCLYALWYIIHGDCDLEVIRAAGVIIKKIIDLINNFNVPINKSEANDYNSLKGDKNGLKRKMSSEDMDYESDDVPVTHTSDEIIESIVSEGDLNLVCKLMKSMDSKDISSQLRPRKKLSLDRFYSNVINFDFVGQQREKSKWLCNTSDGFTSLLDDILVANQFSQNKNIIIDCY